MADASNGTKKKPPVDTAVPPRNFTLTTEERLRAFTVGTPAYARRRRQMETLEEKLLARLQAGGEEAAATREVRELLEQLNDLIDRHNRYFPIEANLPVDLHTGALLDRGERWRPLPRMTIAELLARTRADDGDG